jgi:rhodanese-related sulfurtransferase
MLLLVSGFAATPALAEKGPFPHRQEFKDVPVIEHQALYSRLDSVVVVDVRSHYEYDTLHVAGALNIPLSSASFVEEMKKLRQSTSKPIVAYCNGGTCKKSYQAVKKARDAGVTNLMAYDAGIYAWGRDHPDKSVLLGQSPMRASDYIDDKSFKSRMIAAKEFEALMGPRALVLDIRDRVQRDVQLFPFNEKRAELDDREELKQVIAEAKRTGKTLLVYDKVGKQIRWFQYYLERNGIKNYYFMKGGSEGYYEAKLGKFMIKVEES